MVELMQRLALGAAIALTATGCADLRYRTVAKHDTVLSRYEKVVRGTDLQVRAELVDTVLHVGTDATCDAVEMQRIKRVEEKEPREDPGEELAALALASAPVTTGVVLLVDSQYVYESDRNSRLYNSTGPEGAIVGGSIALGIGTLIAGAAVVNLIRSSIGKETERTLTKTGGVVAKGVPCERDMPARASVRLEIGGRNVNLGRTNKRNGKLNVDLARRIPPAIAKRAPVAFLIVGNRRVGEIDLAPIVEAQAEQEAKRDEQAWQRLSKQRDKCVAPHPGSAPCQRLRAYVKQFPGGAHVHQAQAILDEAAAPPEPPPDESGKTIAVDPVDAKTAAAIAKAREAQRKRCAQSCSRACRGAKACREKCENEVCAK